MTYNYILKINPDNIRRFDKSTRTASEAALALGCDVGQIAKSIIFKTSEGKPVLVVASGSNRVNEKVIELKLNESIIKSDANFVLETTGFVIGGVPPWGHKQKITTFIDQDLNKFDKIWASAGTTNAVFELTFDILTKKTNGTVLKIY
jgi:prolyl-tRNA editing enzyme YbaK/EbsC (Cys-tRNA(Pro) deacylase)